MKPKQKRLPPDERYPADFLAFYRAYPKERHQGYVAPFRSWESLRKKGELPELADILAAIEHQKTTRQWIRGYIPMMTTWLNQKRWEAAIEEDSIIKERVRQKRTAHDTETRIIRAERFDMRNDAVSRVLYNSAKLHSYSPETVRDIAEFFIYSGGTIYYPDVMFPFESCISDTITDLIMLRTKGDSAGDSDWVREFVSTLILAMVCRHGDAFIFDALKGLRPTERESAVIGRILPALCVPELCTAYRLRYSTPALIPVDEWASVVDVSDALGIFMEVECLR